MSEGQMIAFNPDLTAAIAESVAFGATTQPFRAADHAVVGELHDQAFGPGALTRTAYRIREGLPPQSAHCRVARNAAGTVIAFIRFAPIQIGGVGGALLLGPLAVALSHANQGHARRLIADGLRSAADAGVSLVLLVGDFPYYGRIGFVRVPAGRITLPGPVDPSRLLAFELVAGSLADSRGMVSGDMRT